MSAVFERDPERIEKLSLDIISRELSGKNLDPRNEDIIKRVIHTTADFDYADNLFFSEGAAKKGVDALGNKCTIVTDTEMARAGINKKTLESLGCNAVCFMSDSEVAVEAKERGVTRAWVSMERACDIEGDIIFAIGNAPTALISIHELFKTLRLSPVLVIAVPVGFVNVVEAKELIIGSDMPVIAARGNKGGSTVAAAIVNALMYRITRKR